MTEQREGTGRMSGELKAPAGQEDGQAAMAPPPTNRAAIEALIALRETLKEAAKGEMDIAERQHIIRARQAAADEILRLNAIELAEMDKAYAPDLKALATAIEDLKKIKQDIKTMTSSIKAAGEVAKAIAKVAAFLPV